MVRGDRRWMVVETDGTMVTARNRLDGLSVFGVDLLPDLARGPVTGTAAEIAVGDVVAPLG